MAAPRWKLPHRTAALTWTFLLALPSIGFLSLVAPFLVRELASSLAPIVSATLFTFATTLMCLTSCSDPGVIRLQPLGMRHVSARPPPHEVLVKGVPVALKYCAVCDFRRPPRASHCRETDRCIDKWDHYCPWVGNAVGRRNYPYFVCFIVTTCALATHSAVGCAQQLRYIWAQLVVEGGDAGLLTAAARMPSGCVLLGYTTLAALLLAVLSAYHFYLISINQTTYENVRGAFADGAPNPFDSGVCANWAEVFLPSCCRRGRLLPSNSSRAPSTQLLAARGLLVDCRRSRACCPLS